MIVHLNNTNIQIPDNFDNIDQYLLNIEYWNSSRIYNMIIENKDIIIKKFEKNDGNFDLEKDIYLQIMNLCSKSLFFKKFMIKYFFIASYDVYHIILMKKIIYNMDTFFLLNITNIEKKNILFQSLLTIYDMNNKYGIYFNDIFNNNKILNFMINERNGIEKKYSYKLLNKKELFVYRNKYDIQIIDYGRIRKQPYCNTTKYMIRLFNYLYMKQIVSEILLFTLFFYTTINDSPEYETKIIMKLNEILSNKLFKKNSISSTFDTLFLSYLYDNIEKVECFTFN